MSIASAIEYARQEILRDVAAGIIPATVADFGDLHSYVDANMYGGDDFDALWIESEDTPDGDPWRDQNAVQVALDEWIKGGGIADAGESGVFCDACSCPIIHRARLRAWVTVGEESQLCGTALTGYLPAHQTSARGWNV